MNPLKKCLVGSGRNDLNELTNIPLVLPVVTGDRRVLTQSAPVPAGITNEKLAGQVIQIKSIEGKTGPSLLVPVPMVLPVVAGDRRVLAQSAPVPAGITDARLAGKVIQIRSIEGKTRPSLLVPVTMGNVRFQAVFDTAAQRTIIKQRFLNHVTGRITGEKVVLANAEQGKTMEGLKVAAVEFKIGQLSYCWDVIAAPISDDMLLGLDFLEAHQAVVDLPGNIVRLEGNDVSASMLRCGAGKDIHVCRVEVSKRITVPPYSLRHVPVRLTSSQEVDFVIEPQDSVKGLLMGAGIVHGGHHAQAAFLNDSSRFVTLKPGISCGTSVELDCVAEDPENDWIPCRVLKDEEGEDVAEKELSPKEPEGMIPRVGIGSLETDCSLAELEEGLPEHMKSVFL